MLPITSSLYVIRFQFDYTPSNVEKSIGLTIVKYFYFHVKI